MDDQLKALAERLTALPWEGTGIPATLDAFLMPSSGRVAAQGGQARIAYELLAALALAGWSMRADLLAAVNYYRQRPLDTSTYKRALKALLTADLWEPYPATFGRRTAVIVRLTARGRQALTAAGLTVVLAEWDVVEASHRRAGDGSQMAHTAAICVFLHHARVRGYHTTACPTRQTADSPDHAPGDLGQAEPDVLIERAGQRIYGEVQRRGGMRWKKAQKWRSQGALQGFAAICAETAKQAATLAAEAQQGSRLGRGLVTDLATLATTRRAGLWTHVWRTEHMPLEALAADDDRTEAALLTV